MIREQQDRRYAVWFVAAAFIWLLPHTGFAASYTWDSAPGTAGITDGSGTWSTVVTNTTWWNGTANVAWATNSTDTAVFGAGGAALIPSTVTVSGSVRAGGITFGPISTGRWVIQSGTIGLTDSAVIAFENGWNPSNTGYRIDSVITGSNITFRQNQTPANATQFAVNGANSLTGTTTIDGLFLQSTMVGMGGGATIDIKTNSMLDLSTSGTLTSPLIITGTGVGNRGAIRFSAANQILSGPITLTGDAMIANGSAGVSGSIISGAIGETAGGPKNLRLAATSGTMQLRGASTYSGTTTISAGNGTVVLDGGNDRLPVTTVLTTENSNMKIVLGGTVGGAMSQTVGGLTTTQATTSIVGGATGTSTLAVALASGTNTYAGMLGGTATNENNLAFTKSGSGMLLLSGTSFTYTGDTTISGGTLALGASAAAMASSPIFRVGSVGSSGAVFDLTARSGTYTFSSNQTVAGIGTINFGTGKTIQSNGIWAPGNSIGSNAVTGNLGLSGTSQFELGTPGTSALNPGTSDFTSVSGTLTLGGSLQLIDNAAADGNGTMGAGSYRIFTYGNAVSGSFTSITNPQENTRAAVVTAGSGTAAGSGVFVNVYNLASAGLLSGTINLGTVLAGTPLSQSLSIVNAAPAGNYSERLDAAFGTFTGGASGTGVVSLLTAGGTNTSSMIASLSSASAGSKTGSAEVTFASNGDGTSGYAAQSLSPQTVTLTGTVLDPALASFTSGSTTAARLLDFGSINQNDSVSPLAFDLYNLMQPSGFTADLALIQVVSGTGNTGAFTTTLPATFNNLAAGAAPFAYTATFNTSTLGAFTNTYTLRFQSANGGTVYGGDTVQHLTLTVQGIIVVPEPRAVTLAGVGLALAGWMAKNRRRRRT